MKPGETVFVRAWKPAIGERFFAVVKHSQTLSLYWPDGEDTVSIPPRDVKGRLAIGGPFRCILINPKQRKKKTKDQALTYVNAEEINCPANKRIFENAEFEYRPL